MKTKEDSKRLKPEIVLKELKKMLKESQEHKNKGEFWDAEGPHLQADLMLLDLIESLVEDKELARHIKEIFSKLPFWYA